MDSSAQPTGQNATSSPVTPLRLTKRGKSLLFLIPGLRKFLVIARSHLDEALYSFNLYPKLSVPLHHGPDGAPLFRPQIQPGKPRAMVVSIPKSGTYLLDAILREIGLISAGVHLGESGFYDLRNDEIGRQGTREIKTDYPLSASLPMIGPGQIAAGHFMYWEKTREALDDFRVFFAYREGRARFVSYMRWLMHPDRGDEFGTAWKNEPDDKRRMEKFMRLYGSFFMDQHRDMIGWYHDASPLPVKFETLCGDEGEAAQIELVRNIAAHVGITLNETEAKALTAKALSTGSRTWSGERSNLKDYWTEECERIFRQCGGEELNRFLGYA